jgi:hypothetical protein
MAFKHKEDYHPQIKNRFLENVHVLEFLAHTE